MRRHDEYGTFWRLIDTGPLDGARNMAIDEALLHHFDPATSLPVLRLYGWVPPALSIGRFQKVSENLDLAQIRQDELTLVRRITGGGAIYHADELTYALICAPRHIPPATSIKDSFRVLTSFLLDWYRNLGLNAAYAMDSATAGERLGERSAFCFAGKESYDILIDGRKIGGNAQRRLKEIIFQHGSIPLYDQSGKGVSYLLHKPPNLDNSVTSLSQQGIATDSHALKQQLIASFATLLHTGLVPGELTPPERETAEQLTREKYSDNRWNHAGELT